MEVVNHSYYEYNEHLAIFDSLSSRISLLSSYERITAKITEGRVTGLPPMDEKLRVRAERMVIAAGNRSVTDGALLSPGQR